MELIEGIPFGLIICRINGEQAAVEAVSDRLLRVRLDRRVEVRSLALSFLRMKEAAWTPLTVRDWHLLHCEERRLGVDYLIETDDAAYKREIYRVLGDYAAYVRLKSEGDDEAMASELTGCPLEPVRAETLIEQKKGWFEGLDADQTIPQEGWELALSLDRPDVYLRFMDMPFEAFQADFFKRNHLSGHPLFSKRASRVYLGNACCPELCPTDWRSLIGRCEGQGLHATAVLPPIREKRVSWLRNGLDDIVKTAADEIVVNDWGTLIAAKQIGRQIVLGTQLNRRRKDPRMAWKAGIGRQAELLRRNSLNDAEFRAYLAEMGVCRFEYESCGYDIEIAPGKHSLHLPFYQTNTSHACPLAAACEGKDPGLPRENGGCAKPCLDHALLYPEWMGLAGRYNSLFGLDRGSLTGNGPIQRLGQEIDRVVAELL